MDPGTALAVVSLAIQLGSKLGECIKKIEDFKNAPAEVKRVMEEVRVLKSLLDEFKIRMSMEAHSSISTPTYVLQPALDVCGVIEARLRFIADDLDSRYRRHGEKLLWTSLLAAFRKGQYLELERQLGLALQLLLAAFGLNSWRYS